MSRRRRLLVLLLGLSLVRGLVYLAIIPPWQHYDEPTHFEYVRLIVDQGTLPAPGDYRLQMRREIAASMWAHNFWREPKPAIPFWSDRPPDIGVSELQHPPLYYALLALPQLLITYHDVETCLYLARLTSSLFYLITAIAAYGLTAELLPRRRWLPLAVSALVALLPPAADLGSSVNNDVGATAFVSLFLWSSVRLLRRGASPRRIAATLLLSAACIATKNTAGLVAVGGTVVLAIYYIARSHRRLLWAGLAILAPIALVATLSWGRQAAGWYAEPGTATNRAHVETPFGNHALFLARDRENTARSVHQELTRDAGRTAAGQTITLGAWLRSTGTTGGKAQLGVYDGFEWHWNIADVSPEWRFYVFSAPVAADAQTLVVHIRLPTTDAPQALYADGVVLVADDLADAGPPTFDSPAARTGDWSGQAFGNLLANGSAERTWPGLQPWIGSTRVYRTSAALVLASLWDWQRTGWVYGREILELTESFWGRFAWGHLSLPPAYSYVLGALTSVAIIGALIGAARRWRAGAAAWQRWAGTLLGVVLLLAWGSTILRIHPVFLVHTRLYWPVARYASVVIIPTALLVVGGLSVLMPAHWRPTAAYAGLLILIALDVAAIFTVILPYYYG